MNKSESLVKNAEILLDKEGIKIDTYEDKLEEFEKLILPSLKNSKDTLGSLFKYSPNQKFGLVGKIKNKILSKAKNVTINVVERQSMQQQKFNDLVYKSLETLHKEVKELKENK